MNKIGKKLYIMITIVIIFVFGISYLLNNFFLYKYYMYKTKQNLNTIYEDSKKITLEQFKYEAETIEKKNNITILFIPDSNNINELNEYVKWKLSINKITLNKFWITEELLKQLDSESSVNNIYNQGKLKSSFYIKLFKKDNILVLIGITIIHNSDIINIINKFNLYLIIASIIISLTLVWIFSKKIISPLDRLKSAAKDISELKFTTIEIKTNDEIQDLAESINVMSNNLEKAHTDLKHTNENLKILISNISHEMKSPLALINAYTIGLRDGFDDGSYFDIILEQVNGSSKMIDNLLNLSKIQRSQINKTSFNLKYLLKNIIEKYSITLKNNNIKLNYNFNSLKDTIIHADKNQIEIVLNNLISNAIKYNHSNYIDITLKNIGEKNIFISISNENYDINSENIKNIWEPFYVIEQSRNKDITGTGLGLSIITDILKNHKIDYGVNIENHKVIFFIEFNHYVNNDYKA